MARRRRDAEEALSLGESLLAKAAEAHASGNLAEAELEGKRARRVLVTALGPRDPNLAPALVTLARLRSDAGDPDGAARLYLKAAALLVRHRGDAETLAFEVDARRGAGYELIAVARYDKAQNCLENTLRLCRRLPDELETAKTLNALGMLCKYTGRFVSGLRYYRRALEILERLAPDSDELATLHHNLGGIHHAAGDLAAALPHARESVRRRGAIDGPDALTTAIERAALAPILDGLGEQDEAAAIYRDVLPVFRAAGRDYDVAVTLHNLGASRAAAGDPAGAESAYREAADLKARTLGAAHPDHALTLHNLAVLIADTRPGEARKLAADAARVLSAAFGPEHPHVVAAREHADELGAG
ncbi:MAG: tetratricopeptide repeat protein [Myxococcales bacterium]|nr:tetratricopeptide repeat protein [Myxococcales bacterium]MCB9737547.1 tetratricopeptide repeat protein [Deltaproteobacteria bacterium]